MGIDIKQEAFFEDSGMDKLVILSYKDFHKNKKVHVDRRVQVSVTRGAQIAVEVDLSLDELRQIKTLASHLEADVNAEQRVYAKLSDIESAAGELEDLATEYRNGDIDKTQLEDGLERVKADISDLDI